MKRFIITLTLTLLIFSTSSSFATDWYFDKNSKSISEGGVACSDTTGAGTKLSPFCNPGNKIYNLSWNGAQAGDTIYLRGATYTGMHFKLTSLKLNNGTAENPITIRPYTGETVIFDGGGTTPKLMEWYHPIRNLHFIGPFEATGYWTIMDFGNSPATLADRSSNILFDGWTIHNGSAGFILRAMNGATVRNSTFYNLKGNPSHIEDNVIGVSAKATIAIPADNILIENSVAHDINDGKGAENGDADGFHSDSNVLNAIIRNLKAYRCSEDGIDVKAKNTVMENLEAWDNGATGIKMWGSVDATDTTWQATYTARNLLAAGNTETGIKCSGGYGLSTTAVIDNATMWANGQNGFKNTRGGVTGMHSCDMTIRNSIGGSISPAWAFGGTAALQIDTFPKTKTTLDHVNLYPLVSGQKAVYLAGCSTITTKFLPSQYLSREYNSFLATLPTCTEGSPTGSSINETSEDPLLVSSGTSFSWASMTNSGVTGNTLTLASEATYPWIPPVVGQYIEIGDDGVRREITAIGDATTRTITFTPAVTGTVCGRATDCRGVRVLGWTSSETVTDNYTLQVTSPAKDAGVFISGVHCAQADDAGGMGLTGCVHWSGSAPDLGYKEYRNAGKVRHTIGGKMTKIVDSQ